MKCIGCHTQNSLGAKFCRACGASLFTGTGVLLDPGLKFCARCGKSILGNASFCATCGVTFSGLLVAGHARVRTDTFRSAPRDRAATEPRSANRPDAERRAEPAMAIPRTSAPVNRKTIYAVTAGVVLVMAASGGYYAYKNAEAKRIAAERAAAAEAARQMEAKRLAEQRATAEAARRAEAQRRAEQAERARLAEEARLANAREEQARRDAADAKARLARQQQQQAEATRRAAQAEAQRKAATDAQARAVQPKTTQTPPTVASNTASNDPCFGTQGLKKELCTACRTTSGLSKITCETRVRFTYCATHSGTSECR